MASGMDLRLFIVVNLGSLLGDEIEESLYRSLIPRDHRRREDDRVILLQSGLARLTRDDTHEGSISLSLSPCTADSDLIMGSFAASSIEMIVPGFGRT